MDKEDVVNLGNGILLNKDEICSKIDGSGYYHAKRSIRQRHISHVINILKIKETK